MAKQRGFRPSTFFGYQERDKDDRFNWADVGTKASDIIETEAAEREQKKEDYKQQNQIFEKLRGEGGKAATSNNASLNNQIVATTQRSVDKYYEFYKKFTNGEISQSDWVQYRTNIMDGLNNYFGVMSDYAEQFDSKMTRLQKNESQQIEQAQMKQIEGFNNYSQWQTEVGGDGRMYIGRIDEDGNPVLGSGNIFHMEEIRHNVNQTIDVFDVTKSSTEIEGKIGKLARVRKDGKVMLIKDKSLRPEYEKEKYKFIDAQLSNAFNVSSILTNTIGGYNIVYDEKEAGGNNLYVEVDPETKQQTPKPTDKQYDIAREYMGALVDAQIDSEEEADTYRRGRAPKYVMDDRKLKKSQAYLYDAIDRFRDNPTDEGLFDVQAASVQRGGGEIKIDGDMLTIVDKEGRIMGEPLDLRGDATQVQNSLFNMLGGSSDYLEDNKNLSPSTYGGSGYTKTVTFSKPVASLSDDDLLKMAVKVNTEMGADKSAMKNKEAKKILEELENRRGKGGDNANAEAFKNIIQSFKNMLGKGSSSTTKKNKTGGTSR
tara:strand:- start:1084 stop:2709 length:1626 start_codon:yes stop_codon:yes gene_type:complete